MRHMRRWTAWLGLGLGVLALTAFVLERGAGTAEAQKAIFQQPAFQNPPPKGGTSGRAAGLSSVQIIEDSRVRQVIDVGRECIIDGAWDQAVKALQGILDDKKDYYVQISDTDATGRQSVQRWTSAKFEANNLIGSMKPDGLAAYELASGGKAKTMLDDAKKNGDRELLAEVAQRYCHTLAGIEANEILATLYLARGQVFTAALRFEKLLQMDPERAKLSNLTLFKAALAFRRAGDTRNFDLTWARLEKKLEGTAGLKLGGDDPIPVAKLMTVINETPSVDQVNVHDWPSWHGNNRNAAQANGSPPLLDDKLFSRKILRDKLEDLAEDNDQAAETRIQAAMKQVADANQPVMPGFFPICSQGIMVYRSHRDVRAIALKPMKIKYEDDRVFEFKAGEIIWKSMELNRSLSILLGKNDTRTKCEGWLDNYNQVVGYNSLLYDNTVIGTLATDHRHVYAINDLAVPPHPNVFTQFAFNQPQFNPQNLKPLLMQNQLLAFDLFSGRLKWELNPDDAKTEDPEFKNSHFLSLPLAVGGKLYVLNERMINPNQNGNPNPFIGGRMNPIAGESELRLVCIDPTKGAGPRPTIVEPIQVLGTVQQDNRFVQEVSRRVNAVQLAFGDGVLVCPTNAGEVFGIDVVTRSLVWSYPYRENSPQQVMLPGLFNPRPGFPQVNRNFGPPRISKWKSSPPVIADGKIVFTAPDADSVHCISLRDGKLVWKKAQQKGDLFLAGVFKGKAIVVSETGIRALDLKDGSQRWAASTGDLPSGQGVASKDIYYLPLRRGEILAVDVVTGQVKARNRGNGGAAPGNLVFYDGMVLSQTPTEIIAYPQLSVRLASAKIDAAKNPQDMTKLADLGELLLKDGQVKLAVENLLKVYNGNPAGPLAKRVKDRLFEALTDLMHIDFSNAAKDHLTVYKALCAVPDNATEEQNRKAKYFRLVGEGREAEGNLVEAFQMYKDFGGLPMFRDGGGVPSAEDPNQKIPVNVWLRGRISAMLANAKPAQREPLEAKIADEWKTVEAKKDLDAIRTFVGMFDTPVRVGREARVKLAQIIIERNDRAGYLEAELSLLQVFGSEFGTDPQLGGRALAALAQLEEKKGTVDSMRLAATYYRQLGQDFAAVKVRGNKTGADLLNELATDKRFLPFLEQSGNSWGPVKMAARDLGVNAIPVGLNGFVMTPQGDQTPFAKQYRLIFTFNHPKNVGQPVLCLRNLATNEDRWVTTVAQGFGINQTILYQLYQQNNSNQKYHPDARHRFYHVKGHLIVCQVGVMVYCIDGDTGTKLWESRTTEAFANNGFISLQQTIFDDDGNAEFLCRNQQTGQMFKMTLGHIGAVQASYVALVTNQGLNVVDPLRGTTLWKKADVSMNSHVFGDDRHLFLAEANENNTIGAGRTLRAIDGEPVAAKDFGNAYQTRVAVSGRRILSAQQGVGNLTLRLYDIVSGKDIWSKAFAPGAYVLKSEDPTVTGVLDLKGQLTVLGVADGKELVTSNILQGRVTAQDLVNLREPLLLADSDRFYVALNRPIDKGKVADISIYVNGVNKLVTSLNNNINIGTRCTVVNGWLVAVHRRDGQRNLGQRKLAWKKGDLAWHTYMPVTNQMLVLEQFADSPVVLFTARYIQIHANGGRTWVSVTQSFSKASGKMIFDSGPRQTNGASALFSGFRIDPKNRTVNLIGNFGAGSIQHYIDDGKGPPALPRQGTMINPGLNPPGLVGGPGAMPFPPNGIGLPPNFRLPPNGNFPPGRILPPRVRVLPNRPPVVPQKR